MWWNGNASVPFRYFAFGPTVVSNLLNLFLTNSCSGASWYSRPNCFCKTLLILSTLDLVVAFISPKYFFANSSFVKPFLPLTSDLFSLKSFMYSSLIFWLGHLTSIKSLVNESADLRVVTGVGTFTGVFFLFLVKFS